MGVYIPSAPGVSAPLTLTSTSVTPLTVTNSSPSTTTPTTLIDRFLQVVNNSGPNLADNTVAIGGSAINNADSVLFLSRSVGFPGTEYLKIIAAEGGSSGLNNVYTIDRVTNGANERDLTFRSSINSGGAYNTVLMIRGQSNSGSVLIGLASPNAGSTTGYPFIPASSAAPTGTPVAETGFVPMRYDTTNHKLWIYDAGWKGVVVA